MNDEQRPKLTTSVFERKASDDDYGSLGWFGVIWRVNQYGLDPRYEYQVGPVPSKEIAVESLGDTLSMMGVPDTLVAQELAQYQRTPRPWWLRWIR